MSKEEKKLNNFQLLAFNNGGEWDLSITDIDGNLIKQLEWSEFGFKKDDYFTNEQMERMGFTIS